MISKTTAVVLKKFRLNEADNILTLLTSDGSKISAVAKGIRKTKSKFAGRLEPFSIVDLVLYKGKTLYTVTQANTVRDNHKLHDYDSFLAASAMGDIINQVAFEKGNDTELYDLFVGCLDLISTVDDKKMLVVLFDWKIMQALGHSPNLNSLCDCEEAFYLDLNGDGLVCKHCRSSQSQYGFIDLSEINMLKYVLDADIVSASATKNNYCRLSKITDQYINYQLELKLRSRNILDSVSNHPTFTVDKIPLA